jgi:hypothetical protein
VHLVNLLLQFVRVKVELGLVLGKLIIESLSYRWSSKSTATSVSRESKVKRTKVNGRTDGIQEPDNLARLVADDRLMFGIPDDGDSVPGVIVRVGLEVDVFHVLAPEQLVLGGLGEIFFGDFPAGDGKLPAVLQHVRVNVGDVYREEVCKTEGKQKER